MSFGKVNQVANALIRHMSNVLGNKKVQELTGTLASSGIMCISAEEDTTRFQALDMQIYCGEYTKHRLATWL